MRKSYFFMIVLLISQWSVECTSNTNKLTIIAHGTNDLQSVEWAINAGANSVEGDLQFNPSTGEPTIFYHGKPCDCTCFGLRLESTKGTTCNIPNLCSKSTPAEEWLTFLLKFPTLAMVYIDSKTQDLSTHTQLQAAAKVIKMVENSLFLKGFKGKVLIGSELEKQYLKSAAAHAKESPYASQIFLTYDTGKVDPATKLDFMKTLKHPNIVYSTGITSCLEAFSFLHGHCRLAAEYRANGVFSDVIIWTLDSIKKIESYHRIGATGFITNSVTKVANWAKLKGLQLAQPGNY